MIRDEVVDRIVEEIAAELPATAWLDASTDERWAALGLLWTAELVVTEIALAEAREEATLLARCPDAGPELDATWRAVGARLLRASRLHARADAELANVMAQR